MEFRAPTVAAQNNAEAINYLTKDLENPKAGRHAVEDLIEDLGNAVDTYPIWHPIITAHPKCRSEYVTSLSDIAAYEGVDHTRKFVRGFVTCPYSSERADKLVETVRRVPGLHAYRLEQPLYRDNAYPVVVQAVNVEMEADGTIRSRDALAWFVQISTADATDAEVAETWWNLRPSVLGRPHGSRSSLFVNQDTGMHMRKILEAMNASGMFGPILEHSLEMLSQKKRDAISKTLIRAAVAKWDRKSPSFDFEMRGETCRASLKDTWDDNLEISVRVEIGKHDLYVTGFYHPEDDSIIHSDPYGKRKLAEKFL